MTIRSARLSCLPFALAAAVLYGASCGGEEFTAGTTSAAATTGTGPGGTGGSDATSSASSGGAGPTSSASTTASASTTGSGTAGGGGSACADVDADEDGYTDCESDCDDSDPFTHPDAEEICGDGIDNGCGMDPDPAAVCLGLGTFVAQDVGDDANPGTQALPVQTINQGLQNAQTIGNGVEVYVAQGGYGEKIVMVEGHDLLGGYDCTGGGCTWQRDPSLYEAAIHNVDAEGIYAGNGITRATRLDGFRILGASLQLAGNSPVLRTITIDGGTPVITTNDLKSGDVNGCTSICGNEAIRVRGPSNDPEGPLIAGNIVNAGDSTHWAVGVGIGDQAGAEVRSNFIVGGTGNRVRGISVGGLPGPPVLIEGNDVNAGNCAGFGHTAFAVFIGGFVDVTFTRNRVNENGINVGTCPGCDQALWCGGVQSEGGTARITNNVIRGMPGPTRSTALFMGDSEAPIGSVAVNGNVLDAVGSPPNGVLPGTTSAAIALRSASPQSQDAIVGRIRNNILLGGVAGSRFGLFEDNSPGGRTCKPEALENNVFWFEPLGNPTQDSLWREWDGMTGSSLTSLAQVNGHPVDGGMATAQDNLDFDPLLDGSWHLQPASPCIDNGTPIEAPSIDFDGEARPEGDGFDIGADEHY